MTLCGAVWWMTLWRPVWSQCGSVAWSGRCWGGVVLVWCGVLCVVYFCVVVCGCVVCGVWCVVWCVVVCGAVWCGGVVWYGVLALASLALVLLLIWRVCSIYGLSLDSGSGVGPS